MTIVRVSDNTRRSRFEAEVDGVVACFLAYDRDPATSSVRLSRAEVDPRFSDSGVGAALLRWALEQVRAEGLRLLTDRTPDVLDWIDDDPGAAPS